MGALVAELICFAVSAVFTACPDTLTIITYSITTNPGRAPDSAQIALLVADHGVFTTAILAASGILSWVAEAIAAERSPLDYALV
jgi:hypothetical protein